MSKNKTNEIRVLPPRLVPLSAEEERDAVAVLVELLLDAVANGRGGVYGSGFDGGSDRVIGGVVLSPARAGKARKAA